MKVDPHFLNELLSKLIKIDNTNYSNPKDKDGDIGERFVKDSIKFYMWNKGFKLRDKGNRTFKIEEPPKKGKLGADFPFSFIHNSKIYDCYIEVKNWKVLPITPKTFQDEILDRFIKKAKQIGCRWIVTMNKGNIKQIVTDCKKHNIFIIPIDKKITTKQLNTTSLRTIMENFLDDFDKLMKGLTGVKLNKVKGKNKMYSKPYDWDIILGIPSNIIAKRYGTTPNNINKRKSELKGKGIDILDGRGDTARKARIIDKDELDIIYSNIMKEIIEGDY